MHIPIVFEDETILVIDKPSGVTVNVSDTTKGIETIQDWAASRLQLTITNDKGASIFQQRSGIAHRIDKETSGILLIAKTESALENLLSQFKNRTIKKSYLALTHGRLAPKEGEIRVPVGRLPWNRKHFGIIPGGKEAVTRYTVKQSFRYNPTGEEASLVAFYPETGRTHQIRVHAKYLSHPLFADVLYAGRKTARDDRRHLPRVFLHAASITFHHPATGEEVTISSDVPQDLSSFLTKYLSPIDQ